MNSTTSSADCHAPVLAVGILAAKEITIDFISGFQLEGKRTFTFGDVAVAPDRRLSFRSVDSQGVFEISDVTIGIGFHWQQKQALRFVGDIDIIVEDGDLLRLINYVDVETYLKSVISSEMSATASPSLLQAHAVISRSWVLAQIGRKVGKLSCSESGSDGEVIKWYDRDDHRSFDVCADDHCQRYQGITRQTTPEVERAVTLTSGQVLMSGGELCDARFSKCCGGVMERFESCWENTPHTYLQPLRDAVDEYDVPDLTVEGRARQWIESSPDAFCNTADERIIRQVLNNFDQTTRDFYRWEVRYSFDQISAIVRQKSGIDFGQISDLIAVERGPSGRLIRLKIVGEKQTVEVGKELEIRRWLSPTHLYSSAFVVEKRSEGFILRGAGWGHGVGLCQIGAAVMGEKGYDYRQILMHYYPGSKIVKRY